MDSRSPGAFSRYGKLRRGGTHRRYSKNPGETSPNLTRLAFYIPAIAVQIPRSAAEIDLCHQSLETSISNRRNWIRLKDEANKKCEELYHLLF